MMPDQEMIEKCAKAVYNSIKDKFAYVGDSDDLACVTLDREFNILDFVKTTIKAMREPTDKMVDAGESTFVPPDYASAEQCYQAMIDSILND